MGKNPRRAGGARALQSLKRASLRALLGTVSRPRASSIVEFLEKRQLLSHVASHGPLGKLDSTLVATYQQYLDSPTTTPGNIEVQAYTNIGQRTKLVTALKRLNGLDVSGTGREVDAYVPVSNLGKLASLASLRFATTPSYVVNTGSVTSQGDNADIAAAARAAYNISGAGITVGILSDSFNTSTTTTDHYSNDVASGDLPANVQVLSDDSAAGTDEGRAIAQVIYDSAPGVTIKFATALGTASQTMLQSETTMANNITALVNSGCKVIVDDVTYKNEPMFADGIIAQAVEAAIAKGVTYISAGGNLGTQSYAANWSSGTAYSAGAFTKDPAATNAPSQFYAGTSFNFNAGGTVQDKDSFTLPGKGSIDLSFQWDSPYYSVSGGSGATTQLDVYVLNSAGTAIEGGSVSYVVGGDPIQRVTFTNPNSGATTYNLMIVSETATSSVHYIKWVDFAGQATNWAYTSAATSNSTIFGHANAAGVIAVASVNYNTTPYYNGGSQANLAVESSSSTGGTPILFNTSGGRLTTPLIRQEPVVAGPDNLSNTFFTSPGATTHSFTGTSASAASVAGVVALLLGINPSLTPAAVASILERTTIAVGTASSSSPNYIAGYGFVQTQPAVAQAVGNVTGTVYSDNNSNGTQDNGEPGIKGVTVYLDLNNNGVRDANEPQVVTASNGTFAFYNVPTGVNTTVRAITPSGYVALTGSQIITITGGNTTPAVNFSFFPIVYTGTGTSYTLQVDAANPATDDILVGGVLGYTAPVMAIKIPSLTFNLAGNNNTLTVDYKNGNPLANISGGAIYNANAAGSGNTLIVNGTSANDMGDLNFQTTTFDNGVIVASGIQIETINGLGGNDVFSVTTAQPAIQTLTFNGGTGNDSLTVNDALPHNGVGTYFNAGTNPADQNTLTVNMGTFYFAGDPAAASANLTVNDNADVLFAPGLLNSGINVRTLAALNIGPNATAEVGLPPSHGDRAVLNTGTLSIATTGQLDLSGNDLIVSSGSVATLTPLLSSGFNNGKWNGQGIQSSAAATDTTFLTALGMIQNNGNGTPLYGSGTTLGLFDGLSPAAGAILIKYTYYGDTNLSGGVDATDYSRIDSGFLLQQTGWANGDFNYDGVVNGSDYTLMDNAFNTQGPAL
jgi:hypothetical protein